MSKSDFNQSNQLVPCPFCGSTNLIVEPHYDESCVLCQSCGTEGPTGDYKACQDKWNKRFLIQVVKE